MFNRLLNFLGKLVGWAENEGILKYPVKSYSEQVSPTLWRGSRLEDEQDYENLAKNGFKCVINLCSENDADRVPAIKCGMTPLRIPIEDNTCPTKDQVALFLEAVSRESLQPAFVHCEQGVGRTGTMVAFYRVRVQGWSREKALSEAVAHGLKMPCQKEFILKG